MFICIVSYKYSWGKKGMFLLKSFCRISTHAHTHLEAAKQTGTFSAGSKYGQLLKATCYKRNLHPALEFCLTFLTDKKKNRWTHRCHEHVGVMRCANYWYCVRSDRNTLTKIKTHKMLHVRLWSIKNLKQPHKLSVAPK